MANSATAIERRSGLAAVYEVGATGGSAEKPGVTLAERRPLSIVHVAGDPDTAAFADGVRSATGCALPTNANTMNRSGNDAVIWLAPTRWLCVSPDQGPGVLEGALRVACGDAGAVIDVSHGRTVTRLSGPNARDVLMKGPPVDLHASVFAPGSAVQSNMAHCGVLITCIDEDTFDLYCFRAFGQHMWEWLCEASLEYGYEVGETVGI
ncbi:MAG: sarcosine oxidase subunit gamma family protein [Rhodospirillales bacterium]